MDWKETLAALKGEAENAQENTSDNTSEKQEDKTAASGKGKPLKRGKVNIALEKKGRGGKTATILYGFEITDDEISELGRKLKQKLGIGGSSRGGEILLQGDVREKVKDLLRQEGFRV